jgi:hypothetical protein
MNTALEEFKGCVPAGSVQPGEFVPQIDSYITPNGTEVHPLLSDAEIGDLLKRGEYLVQWYADLQAYALGAILEGKEIPGYKVVAGRSNRAFADQDAALETIKAAGYDEALLYERKAKTLSELEKMLGKKTFADLVGSQIVKPVGKPTLVPLSDKREAYSAAVSDFAGVVD